MMKPVVAMLSLSGALVVGATLLHEPVANAAAAILKMAIVEPLDADGNVKVSATDVPGPRLPYMRAVQCQYDTFNVCIMTPDVPAGHLLVIETVSLLTWVPPTSTVPLMRVANQLDGRSGVAAIPVAAAGTISGPLSQFAVTEHLRVYADGLQILVNADGGSAAGSAAFASVYGYLVPKP